MSNFEEAYKNSMMFKMLSEDRLHASILLLTHQEAGQEPQYVSPYTRLAEEMYNLGAQSVGGVYPLHGRTFTLGAEKTDTPSLPTEKVDYAELEAKSLAEHGNFVPMKPPFFFSQLREGMIVVFKGSGKTSFIRKLVMPDDEGQNYYGIAMVATFDSPRSLTTGYLYSYGDVQLLSGRCDNNEVLDIAHIAIPKQDVKRLLNLTLEWDNSSIIEGEPYPEDQQGYIYFGHQKVASEGRDTYYCRAQFKKLYNRDSIVLQAESPKGLLQELEKHLHTFLGLQTLKVCVHIDTLRGDMQNYINILQYGLPRLFLNQS